MMKKILIFIVLFSSFLLTSCKSNENDPAFEYIRIDLVENEKVILSIDSLKNEEITLPVIEREGYSFVGWFFDLEDESSRVNLNTSFSKSAVLYGNGKKQLKDLYLNLLMMSIMLLNIKV